MADDIPRDEKTEDATPRRRHEAREKGQVAQSKEFLAAIMLCAALSGFLVFGGEMISSVGGIISSSIAQMPVVGVGDLGAEQASSIVHAAVTEGLGSLVPLLIILMVVGLIAGFGQVGFMITPKAVELDLARLDPIKGFGRLLSLKSFIRAGSSALKILVISVTMIAITAGYVGDIVDLAGSGVGPMLAGVGLVVVRSVAGAVIAIVALSLIDLMLQRREFEKDLRMSKKEVRDEAKNTEGDPLLKSRIRQVQREFAARRMMSEVPDATVVVTNPTHYAVAIRYDREETDEGHRAPRVVAKGMDHMALRIREVAREAGVLCYEDPPLARAIYAQVEIGAEVPVELYEAIAGVLAYVYRVQGIHAGA